MTRLIRIVIGILFLLPAGSLAGDYTVYDKNWQPKYHVKDGNVYDRNWQRQGTIKESPKPYVTPNAQRNATPIPQKNAAPLQDRTIYDKNYNVKGYIKR